MSLLDMHCHLLPAIDDGYVAKEQFEKMMRIYSECGFTPPSPHIYNPYVTTIEALRPRMSGQGGRPRWASPHLGQ